MMATPFRVAVVMPNFNHGRFLRQSIGALLSQTRPPDRILVLDDGSTDDSPQILAELARNNSSIDLRAYRDNRGAITRISEIMAELSEDYLLFAAADDIALSELLECSCAMLEKYPQAGLCSADILHIDEAGQRAHRPIAFRPLDHAGYIDPAQARRWLLREDGWFWGNTTVYRRTALTELGGFPPELEGFNDGYICRAIAMKYGTCYLPQVLGYWRLMQDGMASSTSGIPQKGLRVAALAERLMLERHRDAFPSEYVQRWKKRWVMNLMRGQLRRPTDQRRDGVLAVWPVPSAFDRHTFTLLDHLAAWPKLHRVAFLGYAYLRQTPFDLLPLARRLLRHFTAVATRGPLRIEHQELAP
jgi:glycosyltransferase involved in cell wall biosynthesis